MHASTISTLSDLFALALTHSGHVEAQGELQAAKTRVAELEGEMQELRLRAAKVEPQFVTVLIDGDGAIVCPPKFHLRAWLIVAQFHGDFMKQGSTGGKLECFVSHLLGQLNSRVRPRCRKTPPLLPSGIHRLDRPTRTRPARRAPRKERRRQCHRQQVWTSWRCRQGESLTSFLEQGSL